MGWRRLRSSVGLVLIGVAVLGMGVLLAVAGAFAILSQDWSGAVKTTWLALEPGAAAAFVVFTCRLLLAGPYVSDKGIRVRTPLRTLAFDWSTVLSVRSQKVTRSVSNPVLFVTARQVCVDLVDGQTVELPLYGALLHQTRHRERTPP